MRSQGLRLLVLAARAEGGRRRGWGFRDRWRRFFQGRGGFGGSHPSPGPLPAADEDSAGGRGRQPGGVPVAAGDGQGRPVLRAAALDAGKVRRGTARSGAIELGGVIFFFESLQTSCFSSGQLVWGGDVCSRDVVVVKRFPNSSMYQCRLYLVGVLLEVLLFSSVAYAAHVVHVLGCRASLASDDFVAWTIPNAQAVHSRLSRVSPSRCVV